MNDLSDLESIFFAALERTRPEDRTAYLDAACAGQAELRRRVEKMLVAPAQAGSFMELPVPGLAARPTVNHQTSEYVGTQIGPYKLLQQIGEGGMGVVYMAEQAAPVRRKLALKIIKPGMDSREVIARFEAERQALSLMDHPNIARVLDAGSTDNGRPYFVMELVKGQPITTYCDEQHLTPHARIELFVPVCHAIQHAHQKGIIHRDIKPSNVLVAEYDGRPVAKVIDFGVAKATSQPLTERTMFTGLGQIVGTLEYMSPEQARVNQLDIDTRSDVYSLGVVLYELLTGSTPLDKQRLRSAAWDEMLRIIREEEPPKPSTRLSESRDTLVSICAQRQIEPAKLTKLVRGELDWIVMKALEKDRNRRYETAIGLVTDIERYLRDEPVQACPPSAAYRLSKFMRRHKGPVLAASLVLLALVAGILGTTRGLIDAEAARGDAVRAQTAERRRADAEQTAKDEAMRRLYRSLVDQARASRLSRQIGRRFKTLEVLAEAAKMAQEMKLPEKEILEIRNQAIACLPLVDLRVARRESLPGDALWLDFDPTLARYALVDRQGVVSIRRLDATTGNSELFQLEAFGPGNFGYDQETFPIFSPDGQWLALHRGERLKVWLVGRDGQTPDKSRLALEETGGVVTSAFSPDGVRLALARADGAIHVIDLPSGERVKELAAGPRANHLAWHPSESRLAISHAGGIQICDLSTGEVRTELGPAASEYIAWHPDGKTLAATAPNRTIQIWDVAAAKPIVELAGHRSDGIAFAFNHAGTLLASDSWDGVVRWWDPRTGEQLFRINASVNSRRFSPDDRYFAAGIENNEFKVWEVAAASGYRAMPRDPVLGRGEYFACSISPKHRLVAVGMRDGVGLWDQAGGSFLRFLPLGEHIVVQFDSSGALLTRGVKGLNRWPVHAAPVSPAVFRIGPPQNISAESSGNWFGISSDGRVLACGEPWGAAVLHDPFEATADRPSPLTEDQPLRLTHEDARYVDVSPDGHWVASGSHFGTKVKIWESKTGKLVHELPVETSSWVRFSPDGRWLASGGGGIRLWEVPSWQPGPRIGGVALAFSPDGQLLAVETGGGVVRLVQPDTGREYASLEDPDQNRAFSLAFSSDSTQLVATSGDSQSMHVWDLGEIRKALAEMKLDWDMPAYRPGEVSATPLRVEVDLGDLVSRK